MLPGFVMIIYCNDTGHIIQQTGAKGDCVFGISDLVKNPDGTNIDPYDKFRCCPEGPVTQIHSPHLYARAPGIFTDLLSLFRCRKLWEATTPIYP